MITHGWTQRQPENRCLHRLITGESTKRDKFTCDIFSVCLQTDAIVYSDVTPSTRLSSHAAH